MPAEIFYGLSRKSNTSQGSLYATDLNVTATPVRPSSPMLNEQRNVTTYSTMEAVRDDSVGVPVKVGRANDYELEEQRY